MLGKQQLVPTGIRKMSVEFNVDATRREEDFTAAPGPPSRGGLGPILLHLGDIFIGAQQGDWQHVIVAHQRSN